MSTRLLTGAQIAQLRDAIVSAFPTVDALEQMVRIQLNEHLFSVVAPGSLDTMAFDLITKWAEARGRTRDLIAAALAANEQNPALQAFAVAQGLLTTHDPHLPTAPRLSSANVFYGDSPRMLGRTEELRRIWEKLRAGNHCSIVGPPGSGKTTLLKELRTRAPQQMGWQASEWLLIRFRSITRLSELQDEIVHQLGGQRARELRNLLRANPLRLLALDDLGWMGAGDEGLKMRRWLRGFAEDNSVRLLITSNKPLDILFRADDPTVDSPFENLDKLPVLLQPLPTDVCRQIVEERLTGAPFTSNDFALVLAVPRQPKELLNLCAARYEELLGTIL